MSLGFEQPGRAANVYSVQGSRCCRLERSAKDRMRIRNIDALARRVEKSPTCGHLCPAAPLASSSAGKGAWLLKDNENTKQCCHFSTNENLQ